MGLFNRKDKETKTSNVFYNDCVASYHEVLKENGYAPNGLVYIPELMPIGKAIVLDLLKNMFYQFQFKDNVKMYYFVITGLSFQAGIACGYKWHNDFSGLRNGYVNYLREYGPAEDAKEIMGKYFGLDNEGINKTCDIIYKNWLEMMEPYWDKQDSRKYILDATAAAYQAGVSMILYRLGY